MDDERKRYLDEIMADIMTAMGRIDVNHHSPRISVTVEGKRQTLSPILQDEVYRIARELLRNAFQHAQASKIEAEIRYDHTELRLRIRDDGKGIDPKFLREGGRAGTLGVARDP
jgi:signal transduction histidine kinase